MVHYLLTRFFTCEIHLVTVNYTKLIMEINNSINYTHNRPFGSDRDDNCRYTSGFIYCIYLYTINTHVIHTFFKLVEYLKVGGVQNKQAYESDNN